MFPFHVNFTANATPFTPFLLLFVLLIYWHLLCNVYSLFLQLIHTVAAPAASGRGAGRGAGRGGAGGRGSSGGRLVGAGRGTAAASASAAASAASSAGSTVHLSPCYV